MPVSKATQKVLVKIPGAKGNKTLTQLYRALPDLKLLMIVRNPVTRMISNIMHEYFNPGGIFEGQELPKIDDILLDLVPDFQEHKNFKGLFIFRLLLMVNLNIIQAVSTIISSTCQIINEYLTAF